MMQKKDKHNIVALREETLTHVRDAKNGYKCGCRCLFCGQNLSAHQGNNSPWHFQHQAGHSCSSWTGGEGGGTETILHWGIKNAIYHSGLIYIPDLGEDIYYMLQLPGFYSKGFMQLSKLTMEKSVKTEKGILIPDVKGKLGNIKLSIEVTNTHETSDIKKSELESLCIDTIEFKLKPLDLIQEKAIKLILDKKWSDLLQLVIPDCCDVELPLRWRKLIDLFTFSKRLQQSNNELIRDKNELQKQSQDHIATIHELRDELNAINIEAHNCFDIAKQALKKVQIRDERISELEELPTRLNSRINEKDRQLGVIREKLQALEWFIRVEHGEDVCLDNILAKYHRYQIKLEFND